jgi:hypothetical protein
MSTLREPSRPEIHGVFVSAITFFAQQNVQKTRPSDFHVIAITENHFFQIKCQLSHSSPKARTTPRPISWEKCHDDEQLLGRGRTVRCDVCRFKRVGDWSSNYPWCLMTESSRECAFTSMAQCLASKHGNVDFCEPNNTFIGNTRSYGSRAW